MIGNTLDPVLSNCIPYVALVILPVVVSIPLDLTSFMWGWRHRFAPMPPEIAESARKSRRYTCFVDDALIVAMVFLLSIFVHVARAQIGLNLVFWRRNLLIGCGMGILWSGLQYVVRCLVLSDSNKMNSRFFQGGAASLWALIFLSGAFAEELWRSLCLVTLRDTGHATGFVVLITAVVFAVAHAWEGPFKALGRFPFGVVAALAFVWTGSLLTTYAFHLIPDLVTIFWIRRTN